MYVVVAASADGFYLIFSFSFHSIAVDVFWFYI